MLAYLEDSSSIVGDQIHTTHLLEHLTGSSQVGAVEQTLLAVGEHSSPGGVSTDSQGSLNLVNSIRDSRRVRIQLQQSAKNLASIINTTSLDQPTRRLGKNGDKNHSNKRQNDLEPKREPPRHRATLDKVEAQINPQREGNAETDEDTISDNVRAALVCG